MVLGPRVEDIAAAKATLQACEAQLDLARRDLADAELPAPADGVVEDRILEPGDMASPQKPVLTLALDDPLWVRVYVAETDLPRIRPGMKASVTTDGFPGRPVRGLGRLHLPDRGVHAKVGRDPGGADQARLPGARLRAQPARRTAPRHAGRRHRAARPAGAAVSPDAAAQIVLELRGVRKQFVAGARTLTALRGVSLAVRRGGVTGLIGPDGAGKTTLMRLAVGLLVPDAGRITVLGHDAPGSRTRCRRSVGYMPQRFGLYEDLSVQENLDLYADLQGVPPEARASATGTDAHDRAGAASPRASPGACPAA
jgi:ABC-type multidrug transport system fused ATPase/permease subunit